MLAVLLASGHAHAEYVRSEDSRKADASAGTRIVYKTLKAELYGDKDPYSLLDAAHGDYNPDHAYPMSNLKAAGHQDTVLPVRASSLVGMRLLTRLQQEKRLDQLPKVIYLDSAHEKDETLMG